MRNAMILGAALMASLAAPTTARETYNATITRTTYNIPHITADTWQGVGYGVAYAYAQDNVCMLAEEFVSIAGERSLHFGPEGKANLGVRQTDNLASDIFHRSQLDLPALRAGTDSLDSPTLALIDGYVAGYNRYLRDTGSENLPAACRDQDWVRPITRDDMLLLNEKQMQLASSLALAAGIANAAPPGEQKVAFDLTLPSSDEPKLGSNGWAFGSNATANGGGLLIGNPHFPWEGPARFWQVHVRGPQGYDVMGVGLAGTPIPTLGFNANVAWTHTVTAARHFTLYQLELSPDDPTAYVLDGKTVPMEMSEVRVPLPGGEEAVRTLYTTAFGPVVTVPGTGLQWTDAMAFAIADANKGNQRALATWLDIAMASSVEEVEAAVSETLGIPWVNTIAADRAGKALHADITAVPNVTDTLLEQCSTPISGLVSGQATLLDGTRAQCNWRTAPSTAPVAGLLPVDAQASRTRTDYVTNSNDSYWISNPRAPHAKLSPILGAHSKALTLRTRSNFTETEAMLAEGKMDHKRAQALVFGNKSLAADLSVEPLLALCKSAKPDAGVSEACAALAGWDRRVNLDSKGAYLFVRFWEGIRRQPGLWAVPFDAGEPINTPRELKTDEAQGEALLKALAKAATELEEAGIALDASWGEVQFRAAGEERIAIHGGPGTAGILNMQISYPVEGGITPRHGSSYIQIVSFDADGPVADAILSYSQSTNPASPHYADQTRNYSKQEWYRLPFSDAEIAAAQMGETLRISE
ncbi:MAG: penicillin acylase family protein [Pseudomonadota bacterium]